jgi:hypothetical protein
MTRSSGLARISLRSARWLLPWIAVLFVSVTLAHALDNATYAGSVASNPEVQVLGTTSSAVMSMTSPASTGYASPSGCCTWN